MSGKQHTKKPHTEEKDIQKAIDESAAEEKIRQKALREQEERELEIALQLSLADNKKSNIASLATSNPTQKVSSSEDDIKQLAGQYLQEAMNSFSMGKFVQSVPEIQKAIHTLAKHPKGHQTFPQEILFSVAYYQAIHFLIEMQRLQSLSLYEQMGLVSKFLCEIPVQVPHRLILFRIALKTNFQLGNFETAGRLMQMMAAIPGLPETEVLKKMYTKCEEEKFVEHSRPINPSPKLCFKSLRLIITDTFDLCEFCGSSFRPGLDKQCIFCVSPLKNFSVAAFLQAQAQAQAQSQAMSQTAETKT